MLSARVVTVHYRAWRKGNIYEVQGDLHINVNDYDIPTPSFLGVTVRPSVDIDAFFQLLETWRPTGNGGIPMDSAPVWSISL